MVHFSYCLNGSGPFHIYVTLAKNRVLDENMKKTLACNNKAYNLDIWYVASSSGHLPSLFQLCHWGPKWSRFTSGHI